MEITVAGRGRSSLPPERATVRMTVGFEAPDPQTALARTTDLVRQLTDYLAGFAAMDPAPTTWSAVEPIRTRSWRPWSDKGNLPPMRYGAISQVQVKFRDTAALAHFLDGWGGVEGVTVGNVNWTLTDATRVAQESAVLREAVERARERAQIIATAAGAGEVRLVEVADPGLLGGQRVAQAGGAPQSVASRAAMGGGAPGAGTPAGPIELSPEDVELHAVVHARFTAD